MPSSPRTRRWVKAAGVRTAYLDAGEGAPVVAIHGVPTSSELFEPLLPALEGFRVVAPDLLGGLDLLAPWRLGAVRRRLSALRVPALVVWGDRDDVFPPGNARPILAALPGAQLRLVPGAGHWSMLDAPDVVAAHVGGFLRAEARGAGA